MSLASILGSIPPAAVYAAIGGMVGVESLGVPVPGETALIIGALLSSPPQSTLTAVGVALAGIIGAVLGDSIGYTVGRRLGPRLFATLGRRFPRHFSSEHIAYAEHLFHRYGMAAVFGGRFVALLRILFAPLAGSLHMPYFRFLVANAAGGAAWAGGLTLLVHLLGAAAHQWISSATWILLVLFLLIGLIAGRYVTRAFERHVQQFTDEHTAPGS